MKTLVLNRCKGGYFNDVSVRQVIATSAETLEWLDFGHARSFISALGYHGFHMPKLHTLILDFISLSHDFLYPLLAITAQNIRRLSLHGCTFENGPLQSQFGQIIGCQSNLEYLDLSGTRVDDPHVAYIENNCPKLKYMKLDGCRSVTRERRGRWRTFAADERTQIDIVDTDGKKATTRRRARKRKWF